jgi:hypothetical protein
MIKMGMLILANSRMPSREPLSSFVNKKFVDGRDREKDLDRMRRLASQKIMIPDSIHT